MFFNQVNIWQYEEGEKPIETTKGKMVIYHPGEWQLKKYEDNKKVYNMQTVFDHDNIISFCYYLNNILV